MPATKQLNALKETLLQRKEQILANLEAASKELSSIKSQEINDDADFAVASTSTTVDNAIYAQQKHELEEISQALEKFSSESYGLCEMCEEEIDIERLKAKPFAKYCIACREINESNHKE